MSKEWYLMKSPPSFLGGYETEDFNYYSANGFEELLNSFLGRDVLQYGTKISTSPTEIRCIIQNTTADTQDKSYIRQILCKIGTLKCGQYLRFDNAYWLVVSLPGNNGIYEKVIVWYCNMMLNMKSRIDGSVIHYPIFANNATQYNVGEVNKEQITIGSSQYLIYLPYNEETILFDNDDRLLIDKNKQLPNAYRITQVDPVSYSYGDIGLLRWMVAEDQFSDIYDDKTFLIADCYKEIPKGADVPSIPEEGYAIVVPDATDTIQITSGENRILQVEFYENGTEIQDFVYQVEIQSESNALELIDQQPHQFEIKATGEKGTTASIVIREGFDRAFHEIKVQIVGWW